jgi:hypothetical protein
MATRRYAKGALVDAKDEIQALKDELKRLRDRRELEKLLTGTARCGTSSCSSALCWLAE